VPFTFENKYPQITPITPIWSEGRSTANLFMCLTQRNSQLAVSQSPFNSSKRRIYLIRGHKVMIDVDLAELYGVPTKRLNQQVQRNSKRFPEDFMFQLTKAEAENLRLQFATSRSSHGGAHCRTSSPSKVSQCYRVC